MSYQVEINWEEFQNVHSDLENARSGITDITLNLSEGQMVSEVIPEFIARANELKDIIVNYEHLLWEDSVKLLNAAKDFETQDRDSSKNFGEYFNHLTNSVYPDEAE